jgi:hypothetical protein
MKNVYPADRNIQEKADELIDSFRSSFWIDEHKWFVRCAVYDKTIQLQALSNIYFTLEKNFSDSWKSTYPYDDRETFYNTIRSIDFDTFFDEPIPSFICLQNIEILIHYSKFRTIAITYMLRILQGEKSETTRVLTTNFF